MKLIALSAFLMISKLSFSQIKITGKIINQDSKPVEFAEILLLNKDSVAIKSELTDKDGFFSINAKQGSYIFQVRQFKEIAYTKSLEAAGDLDLGAIRIEKVMQLQKVVIEGKKPLIERKIDRLVFNVENSIAATGGDALDALRVTPGIRVQDDKISMIGKSGIAVMIDDRLTQLSGNDLLNFLKTIKADDIKSIEVITNPPAKYDAEGNSGIVNLKLKKAKPNSWSSSVRSRYRQAVYAMGIAGGNFTYQKNKFSLFANVSYNSGAYGSVETNKINYPDQLWVDEEKRKEYQNSLDDKIGIDYDFSKKLTLGVQYAGSYEKPNDKANNLTNIINNTDRQADFQIKTASSTPKKTNLNSLNCHAIYKIDSSDKKISVDFDYFNYQNNRNALLSSNNYYNNGDLVPNSYFSLNDVGIQNISNHSLNLDMEMPAKRISLNYGGKLSFSNTRNDIKNYNLSSGSPVFNPLQSNEFNYKENVQALYFSANKKIGKNWESKIGLRMENTQITGNSPAFSQSNKSSYAEFFPTAYIAYNPNENNSLSVNYGRRISRPPFFFLNPFKWSFNRYGYVEGNPYLRPSYTNNIEFNYTYKENWSNGIYVSFTENGYGQISILDYPNQKIYAANYYKGTTIGLSESYTYNKLKRWSSVNSFNLSYSYAKSKIPILLQQKEGFNAFFSTSNDFILNGAQTLLFNISYWYLSPRAYNLKISTSCSQLDASLKMLLLHKNLQITIAGKDIFRTNIFRSTSYSNGIEVSFRNYYDYRSLSVSLLYKFGNNLLKSNQRSFGNEEEKNRAN